MISKNTRRKTYLIVAAGLLVLTGLIFVIYQWRLAYRAQQEVEQKAAFEQLMKDPKALFERSKKASLSDSPLKKIDYKDSTAIDTMLRRLIEVLDTRSTEEELQAVKRGDKAAKRRNDTVLALLGQRSFENVITTDLGIQNQAGAKYHYYFYSGDYRFNQQKSDKELNNLLVTQTEKFCVTKELDCRVVKERQAQLIYITLRPIKINDEPLTYRVYSLLRLHTGR